MSEKVSVKSIPPHAKFQIKAQIRFHIQGTIDQNIAGHASRETWAAIANIKYLIAFASIFLSFSLKKEIKQIITIKQLDEIIVKIEDIMTSEMEKLEKLYIEKKQFKEQILESKDL